MSDCIFRESDGTCREAAYAGKRCSTPATCEIHAKVRASVQAAMDAGVPPRGDRRAFDADDLGGESLPVLEPIPHAHVQESDTEAPRDQCGSDLRPVVFGVAGIGAGGAALPIGAMVCGRALDRECAHPCYFGMYSRGIMRAHKGLLPAGAIVTPAVQRVRSGFKR